jgi:hypothetical protein
MRKSPGHVPWVRALKLKTYKVNPPKLYKIKLAKELIDSVFERSARENDVFVKDT